MNDALGFLEIASWSVTSCAAFSFAISQLLITLSEKNCDNVAVLFVNLVSKIAISLFSSCFEIGCGGLILIVMFLLLLFFFLSSRQQTPICAESLKAIGFTVTC